MRNPHCPVHVSVRMKKFSIERAADKRPSTKAVVTRTYFRCPVLGCPRVEEDKTFYRVTPGREIFWRLKAASFSS